MKLPPWHIGLLAWGSEYPTHPRGLWQNAGLLMLAG